MAPRVSVPTATRLPSSLRVEASHPAVVKALNKLSRPSLLSIVLDWLDDKNQGICPPLLRPAELDEVGPDGQEQDDPYADDFYPPARSVDELQELYSDLQDRRGGKREVVDRIIEGDWRQGLSLYQLALVDIQYLYDHPLSLKWGAFRIQPLRPPRDEAEAEAPEKVNKMSLAVPRFHPSTFLQNLQAEVLPDVKAHYQFERHRSLPLSLLRIFVLDSPYTTSLAVASSSRNRGGLSAPTSFDASRTIYLAFPDAAPYIYISKSTTTGATTTGDTRSLRSLLIDGVPKALSKPKERYALTPVGLSTKNLDALLSTKGSGRTNAAGGGWGIYVDDSKTTESPLNVVLPTPPPSAPGSADEVSSPHDPQHAALPVRKKRPRDPVASKYEREIKRHRSLAKARFGHSALAEDGKGIERLDIVIEDAFPHLPESATNNNDDDDSDVTDDEEEEDDNNADASGRQSPSKSTRGRRSTLDITFIQQQAALDAADPDNNDDEDMVENAEFERLNAGTWRPNVRLTFHGPHVFAGVRQLVEAGVINGERMPGWLTGEEGVTIGAVRSGRIRGHKGSGL
ncbi:centromere protein Chl4/mis15/CENP-N [Microdochium trichocladiopsis]|uniref:Centromere protein Chl4/mis15/CENP-N n=1 Tax=Microdochium trichocladiopsis TaxID=1682393 RepID=A0A9P9BKF8_9PEZI|nr:centromere protein Chl4/mis15/CENP-N [Microdochium trichocladiopsis]KAH7021161.1 centromere protein Chl4/mis15/CENP-N [Microdochium trichocladiopsis]